MKILFVCQYFYPEIFRGNDIVFDWAERGETVTVITAIPNYPEGKFFDGYGIFKKRKEHLRGVNIIRIPVVSRGKGGAIRLLLNYFSFAFFASIYCFFLAFKEKFDFVFVQQLSPVLMALPAIIVKKIQKIPLYTWVLDLWPESLTTSGGITNKYVLSFFEKIVRIVYNNSTKILISSKGFIKSIVQKGNYDDKIIYYPNWAESVFTEKKKLAPNSIPELPNKFLVMFAGNIGESQDFENIMKSALILKKNEGINFVIIGDGRKKDWVTNFIKENHLEKNVFVLGRFPIHSMPEFFEKASVMLLPLKNELIFNLTVPAKLQAYMAFGKPIIGMLNGEGANIIEEANCGLVANAGDYNELAQKIELMCNFSQNELLEMGRRGKEYCNENFDKNKSLDYLYNLVINTKFTSL